MKLGCIKKQGQPYFDPYTLDMANILHTVRITTLGMSQTAPLFFISNHVLSVLTLLFSFIVLGLTAYITNGTESTREHIYFTFALLSLIVSVISIVTILPMYLFINFGDCLLFIFLVPG